MSDEFVISAEGSTLEEFHARHRDQKDGKKLPWLPDFYRSKEGVMTDRKAPLMWRLVELGKCRAWGNQYRDYFSDENGNPLTQRDLATILGVSYQRVSEAVEQGVEQGYFRREGRVICIVDDPAAVRAQAEAKKAPKVRNGRINGEERAKFLAAWAERYPEQFKEYQKLGKEIEERFERQRQMQEAAWEWFQEEQKKSGTGGTNDSAEDPERDGQNVRNGADESSGTGRIEDEPILNGFNSYLLKLASLVDQAVSRSGLPDLPGNRDRAVRAAAGRITTLAPNQLNEALPLFEADLIQIARRRENKPKSWGIVVSAMEDAIEKLRRKPRTSQAEGKPQAAPTPEPSVAEQIASLEALLETSPHHPQAPSWRSQIDALKRKPAESEPRAKAQKAGQA